MDLAFSDNPMLGNPSI